jgi:ketosteroid isomerase-like protein
MDYGHPGAKLTAFSGCWKRRDGIEEFFKNLRENLIVTPNDIEMHKMNGNVVVSIVRATVKNRRSLFHPHEFKNYTCVHVNFFNEQHQLLHQQSIADQATLAAMMKGFWSPPCSDCDRHQQKLMEQQEAATQTQLDSDRMLSVANSLYERWRRGDIEWLLTNVFSDDALIQSGYEQHYKTVDWQGQWRGNDGITTFFSTIQSQTILIRHHQQMTVLSNPNRVIVIFRADVAARESGRILHNIPVCQIFSFTMDYRIKRFENYFDTGSVAEIIKGNIGEKYADDGH